MFLIRIEKTQISSCEHIINILMGFQSHIRKIKFSYSVYTVNFDMS
jgi:hypothetical protein